MSDTIPKPTGLTRLVLSDNPPPITPPSTAINTSRLFVSDVSPAVPTTPGSIAVEVQSTTGGFVLPRMTTTQRLALVQVNGMLVYDTTLNRFYVSINNVWGNVTVT